MSIESMVGKITTLVALRNQHEADIEALSKQAADRKKLMDEIDRIDLPEMLREAELTQLVLSDGTQVKLGEKVTAAISAANKAEAHKWLREHEFGGIIKVAVTVEFAAKDSAQAEELGAQLSESYGNAVTVEEGVHTGTLKAFVAERLEQGDAIPTNLFGIFTFSEVKVKAPKSR